MIKQYKIAIIDMDLVIKLYNKLNPYYMLGSLCIITIIGFWPGWEMYDSTQQYQQALVTTYSDHHPPLMAFVWHYLNLLYPGSGLMFCMQVLLFYASMFILLKITEKIQPLPAIAAGILLVLFPIYPQVFLYLIVILKDVQFANSFLLACTILAYYTMQERRPPALVFVFLMALLIYGAAVKYQAIYCVLVPALWLSYILFPKRNMYSKTAAGLAIYAVIFYAIICINAALVAPENKNYSWQYVKLYDLAAISLSVDKDLIPSFNKKPEYTFADMKKRFEYPAIDSLVFLQDPILTVTKDHAQMQRLRQLWQQSIAEHLLAYLKHRCINMKYILLARPGYEREAQDVPYSVTNNYKKNSLAYYFAENTIGLLFYVLMSHLPVVVLGLLYLIVALRNLNSTPAAIVLLGFSATAILMLILLFFMSMAGTPRYTYISIIMIHAAHIFAYACLKQPLTAQIRGIRALAFDR